MRYGLSICFAAVFAAAGFVSCVSIQKGVPPDPQEDAEVLGKVSARVTSYQLLHIVDKDMALAEAQAALAAQAEKQYGKGVEVQDIDVKGSFTPWSFLFPFSPLMGNFQKLQATGQAVRPEPDPLLQMVDAQIDNMMKKPFWSLLIGNRSKKPPVAFRFGVMYEPASYVSIGNDIVPVNNHMDATSFTSYEIALTSTQYLKGLSFIMDLDLNDTFIGQVGGLALSLGYKRLMLRVTTAGLSGTIEARLPDDQVEGVSKVLMSEHFDGSYFDAGLFVKIAGPVNLGLLYTRWSFPTFVPGEYNRRVNPNSSNTEHINVYVLDSDMVYDYYGLGLTMDTWRWYMEAEQRRRVKIAPWVTSILVSAIVVQTMSDSAQNRLQDQYPDLRMEIGTKPVVGIIGDAYIGAMAVIKAGKRAKIGVGAGANLSLRASVTGSGTLLSWNEYDILQMNLSDSTFWKSGFAMKAGVSF